MKGFKNTTRTQYSMGGDVYAKGGMAKGAAKISKVMGEFKKGELHSGSKEGPKVTKPAQAKAIAMSEARKAGMKAPMKKNEGGKVGKMPPLGESVKSGNRMSKMTAAEMRAMEARFGEKKRPSPADSAKSANRISAQEAAEARALGVFKEGGKVRKYAAGGAVTPFNPTQALNAFSADLAKRVKAGTMTVAQAQQAQTQFRNQVQLNTAAPPTRQGAEGIARNIMLQSQQAAKALQDFQSDRSAGGGNSFGQLSRGIIGTQPGMTPTPAQPPMGRPEMPADFGHLPPGVPGFEQQYAQPPMKTPTRSQVSTAGMTPEQFLKFQYEQERAIHSNPSSPFHHMYFPQTQPPVQRPDMDIQVQPPMKTPMTPPPMQTYTPPPPMQTYTPPMKMYVDPYLPDRAPRQPVMPTPPMPPQAPQGGLLGRHGAPSTQPSMPTTPMVQPPAIDRFATATLPALPPGFRMGGMAKRRPC